MSQKNSPLVSILIPVFNRENIITETLDSAVNQTYRNIEIIVVDNCSTDNTWNILENYSSNENRLRIYKNDNNIGPVRNWKRCAQLAKGEFVKMLFSDDLISENFISETLINFNDDVAFVLSRIVCFNSFNYESQSNFDLFSSISIDRYYQNILFNNELIFPVSPGAALFRTKDFLTSIEIDIDNPRKINFAKYGAGNDLLIYLNTTLSYSKIRVANKAVSFFRSHSNSLTLSHSFDYEYAYAKYHFINFQMPLLLPKLKSFLWLRGKLGAKNYDFFKLINCKKDWFFIFKFLVRSLYRRAVRLCDFIIFNRLFLFKKLVN